MLALQGKVRGTPWPLWLGAADKRQAGAIIQDRGSGLAFAVPPLRSGRLWAVDVREGEGDRHGRKEDEGERGFERPC